MKEWKNCTLGELGKIVGGATPSTKKFENYEGGTIPWITPKDLSGFLERYIAQGERNITEAGLRSCSAQLLPKHSVLFSSRAPIGYIAIAACEVCTNQGFKSIIPNNDVDYMFLYYLLKFKKGEIENMGSGTTFKEVSAGAMKNIQVRVPAEKSVQIKIAKILSSLDDKIELNNRINDNLEQQATVLVNRYLSVITETVAFSEIIDFVNGFAFQSRTYLPAGQYRIITIKNVQDGKIDSTGASCIDCLPQRMKTNCILQIGDVLLSLTGNVGRVGIVCENNLLLNQRVAKFVPHRKELLPFLYFIFRHPSIKTQMESIAKGTAQLNLSPIETLNLSVPFEKTKALELSKVLSPIYQFIISNNQQNILLSSLRDELLPKLMSGEIDISDIKI